MEYNFWPPSLKKGGQKLFSFVDILLDTYFREKGVTEKLFYKQFSTKYVLHIFFVCCSVLLLKGPTDRTILKICLWVDDAAQNVILNDTFKHFPSSCINCSVFFHLENMNEEC